MKRREFFETLIGLGSVSMTMPTVLRALTDDDALICNRKFELAFTHSLHTRPLREVITEIGKSFLGTEYLAQALEVPGEERLVVNLRGLDCVSFCENALVLARCVKMKKTTFEDYKAQLQLVRYRGGIIHRYPSRLHYFTDWIHDNEKKTILRDVTKEIGGETYRKKINFMSTHVESYRQLRENPEFVQVIEQQEAELSKRALYYVPKEKMGEAEAKIQDGDLLAITTTIEGLDVSHTGIALHQNNRLHMMHAPDVGYRVTVTELPLMEHLRKNKRQSGIIVARAIDPA